MGTSASTQSHHNAKYLKVNIRYCKFTHRKLLLNYQAFVCPKHLHFVLATGTSYTYRLLGLLYRKVYLVYTDGLHGKQHKKKHAHTHIKKKIAKESKTRHDLLPLSIHNRPGIQH